MTIQETKDLIVQTIIDKQGMKATELCAVEEVVLSGHGIPKLIDELVKDGKLVELEYVLPQMHYKFKSFLLPANTRCSILGSVVKYQY